MILGVVWWRNAGWCWLIIMVVYHVFGSAFGEDTLKALLAMLVICEKLLSVQLCLIHEIPSHCVVSSHSQPIQAT